MTEQKYDSEELATDIPTVNEMSKDYSRYFCVDASKERQVFYDNIEEMLTKLDEFGGLVDMVRSDTGLCVNKTVPEIQAKCEDMKHIFTRIDQLEAFVNIVRQNVSVMEDHVNKAENEMGTFSGFKKMFSSLVGTKKSSQPKEASFIPPSIFVTEEYLQPVSRKTQQAEAPGEQEEKQDSGPDKHKSDEVS